MKKKLIVLAAVAAVTAGFAAAEVSVGIRGGMGLMLGTSWSDKITEPVKDIMEPSTINSLAAGAAVFAKIPIFNGLGIQPEFGISYNEMRLRANKEYKELLQQYTSVKDYQEWFAYSALDIPILVSYDFKVGKKITLTPLAGPKLSIPIGKIKEDASRTVSGGPLPAEFEAGSPVLFSMVAGMDAAFGLRHGAIVTDLRYDIGISSLQIKTGSSESDVAVPRALFLSVGYQLTF